MVPCTLTDHLANRISLVPHRHKTVKLSRRLLDTAAATLWNDLPGNNRNCDNRIWSRLLTFEALRTGTPGYLSDLLEKQTTTRRTRSQSSDAPDRLVVPLYSGERSAGTSYSVAAPKLWNSLPANIRNSRSLDTFKKHLKTHYFKEHFYGI